MLNWFRVWVKGPEYVTTSPNTDDAGASSPNNKEYVVIRVFMEYSFP